eukprot:16444797-Heterocapsa_arctica.AAC.2
MSSCGRSSPEPPGSAMATATLLPLSSTERELCSAWLPPSSLGTGDQPRTESRIGRVTLLAAASQ